jgi:hypothetical protein
MSFGHTWGKAVACARAALATSDPIKRGILVYLAEFWLALAHCDTSQINEAIALDVAEIERVQANILGEHPSLH